MKGLIFAILITIIGTGNSYSQDVFGNAGKYNVSIIFAGQITQSSTGDPEVTAEYNPYGVDVTGSRDSVGRGWIELGPFVSEISVTSGGLHPILQSNTYLKTAKTWAVASNNTITLRYYIKEDTDFSDNYQASLILYYLK